MFRRFLRSVGGILIILPGIFFGFMFVMFSAALEGEFPDVIGIFFIFLVGFGMGSFPVIPLLLMYVLWRLMSNPAVERWPRFFYKVCFTVVATLFIFVFSMVLLRIE